SAPARLWDLATRQQIRPALQHSASIWPASSSPAGRTIMTGTEAGQTQFWLAATGLPIGEQYAILGNVTTTVFSPDGNTALGGRTYDQAAATLWQAPHGPADILPSVRTPNPTALAFSPDRRILPTA